MRTYQRGRDTQLLARSLLLSAALLISACATVRPPQPADWSDAGAITAAANPGAWDARTFPGIHSPTTVTTSAGDILLYYVGAAGDRVSDGGPRGRSVGLIVGRDDVYKKHPGNPVLSWFPNPEGCNGEEEGIWRPAVALHGGSEVVVYFGAITQTNCRGSVQSDVRVATSPDGRNFSESVAVIEATDKSAWGTGKKGAEVFPVAAYEHRGNWTLFYVSREVEPPWSLGVARGASRDEMTSTQALLMADESSLGAGSRISTASVWPLDSATYALFLQVRNEKSQVTRLEVRTFDPSDPSQLSEPATVYEWRGYVAVSVASVVMLDRKTETWNLYYATDGNGIRKMTAPVHRSATSERQE